MAEGDSFAGWLKDVVNSTPILGAYTSAMWGPGNWDPNAAPTKDVFSADASVNERIASLVNTIPFAHITGDAVSYGADNFAPLKFVLDFGNRTVDSFFTGAQAEDDSDPETSFFDGWKHGWDSWGTEDHLTAGQIVGASINSGLSATGLSPFTPQGVKATQTLSKQTWYGEVAGAATDISAGFLGVPVGRTARLTQAGKTLDSLGDAERVTEAFNTGQRAGRTESLFKPNAPQVHASRLELLARETLDNADSMVDAMNYLGPKTSEMNGRGVRLLAEIATSAKKELSRDMAEHIMGNAYLAAMGSDAARAELMSSSPLLAAKMANGTLAPQVFGNAVKARELLIQQRLADPTAVPRLDQIMAQVYDTPRKLAEQRALQIEVEKATEAADQVKSLRQRMAGLRPRNRMMVNGQSFDLNADNLTIKESRIKAESQYRDLQGQLAEAKADLAGTKRWAGGAKKTGDVDTTADLSEALGKAQQKVDDLTQQLSEARSDFDLLKSTPLDENGYTLPQWRDDMAKAGRDSKVAARKRDFLIALNRTAKRELAGDAAAARQIRPGLSATNQWLTDLETLGQTSESTLASLRIVPSKLERLKTSFRNDVGASYLYDAGEFNRKMIFHVMPKSWAANIGTAYGRSAINTLDRYTGLQELGMYLKKSKVFQGDEIRAYTEQFLRQPTDSVAMFVEKVHDDMLQRLIAKEAPDLSPEDVANALGAIKSTMHQSRSYLTEVSRQADAEGAQWATLHEFPGMDASDAIHRVDAAYLRSHLAETVAFADPFQITRALRDFQSSSYRLADGALDLTDLLQSVWKLGQLMRPGLMVRNMLDSNIRALSIMGTVPTAMSAVNGMYHLARNTHARVGDWASTKSAKIPGLQKIALHNPHGYVRTIMNSTDVKLGGQTHEVSLYDMLENGEASASSIAMNYSAMTKGSTPSQGLLATVDRPGARFRENAQIWKDYKADSVNWPKAYAQHAQVLLASPTAKKIIEWEAMDGLDNLSLEQFTKELFSDPAVRKEYNDLLRTHDMDQLQWVEQVVRETEVMFPEPGMAADLLAGRFKGAAGQRWIESHFPRDQRFDVPGFETVFESTDRRGAHIGHIARELTNKTFNALQDAPDFWLARHPVAVNAFRQRVKQEAAALEQARVAKFGEDAEFTAEDIAKIERRARTHAISTVRTYMYDATRNTGLSASAWLHRFVPFFAPWQDTMRAYSRLLLDDPSRLGRIAGVYNVPFNLNTWVDDPFIVDQYGNRVPRGAEPEGGTYILVGGKWGTNDQGQRVLDGGFRLRASSFNTILQGEVPWLPGWGPAVQIPVTMGLNNNRELALQLSNSDNPGVQTLMRTLFQDGEVPMGDQSALAKSLIPSWLRRFQDAREGVAFGRNVGYLLNAKYMESLKSGQPFDYKRAYAEAQAEAKAAAWPLVVSQFGFGISGDAQVQGKFYVDKMHEFMAMAERPDPGTPSLLETMYGPDADPTWAFSQQFPEAAGLSWSFTRNETGIQATVTAQQTALRNKGLIDENPTLGWFIVGADNVGGEWSQTAYNQQKMDGYGIADLSRKQLSNGDIAQKAVVSQGWDQFTKLSTALSNYTVAYDLDTETVDSVKQAIIASLGQENPEWFAEYNNRENATQDFYQRADLLAKDPRLANRQDIAMYVTYRQAMQQVLDAFGIKSLAGSSENSANARMVMNQIGSDMARQNIGFQQMWDRVLYNDVKPKPTDWKYGYGGVPGAESGPVSDVG